MALGPTHPGRANSVQTPPPASPRAPSTAADAAGVHWSRAESLPLVQVPGQDQLNINYNADGTWQALGVIRFNAFLCQGKHVSFCVCVYERVRSNVVGGGKVKLHMLAVRASLFRSADTHSPSSALGVIFTSEHSNVWEITGRQQFSFLHH